MRLAVVGANGLTGVQVVRAAQRRGMEVLPIVRDERNQERVAPLFAAGEVRYADPHHLGALAAALEGADQVIALLDPRTAGPGEPWNKPEALANVVRVAAEQGLEKALFVSVMGAFRWSTFKLNRRAFWLEQAMLATLGPWSLVRVSCYHDEVLEAHVRPPDGGRPRPVPGNGQYAPMSRAEAGRLLLDALALAQVARIRLMGGPKLYNATALAALLAPYARPGRGARTAYLGLPRGDVAVSPKDTAITSGHYPVETLEAVLEGRPVDAGESIQVTSVYPAGAPEPSAWDLGRAAPVLAACGPDLRRIIHEQLVHDLRRRGLGPASLDFGSARRGRFTVRAHGGEAPEMMGVRAVAADGRLLYEGDVLFIRDELAEVFVAFFGSTIPAAVWDELDLGVRRRLKTHARWRSDPRVMNWNP